MVSCVSELGCALQHQAETERCPVPACNMQLRKVHQAQPALYLDPVAIMTSPCPGSCMVFIGNSKIERQQISPATAAVTRHLADIPSVIMALDQICCTGPPLSIVPEGAYSCHELVAMFYVGLLEEEPRAHAASRYAHPPLAQRVCRRLLEEPLQSLNVLLGKARALSIHLLVDPIFMIMRRPYFAPSLPPRENEHPAHLQTFPPNLKRKDHDKLTQRVAQPLKRIVTGLLR